MHTETLDADWRHLLRRQADVPAALISPLRRINNSTGPERPQLLNNADAIRAAYGGDCELLGKVTEMETMVFERFGYERRSVIAR